MILDFQKLDIPLAEGEVRKMILKLNNGLEGSSAKVRYDDVMVLNVAFHLAAPSFLLLKNLAPILCQ